MTARAKAPINFEKWQALGNDYLILERDALPFELTPARVRLLCAPHFGVFADGVLLLSRSVDPEIVADLRIFNPDGSEAELSGNGAREAILYLRHRGWTDRDSFTIHTAAGPIRPQITGPDSCRVDMGRASLASNDYPEGEDDGEGELSIDEPEHESWGFRHVSIGNPQCAIPYGADEVDALDLSVRGPAIEAHPLFPNRTNVSWFGGVASQPGDPPGSTRIRARIFERGVGETLSSGTGAVGAAVAQILLPGDLAFVDGDPQLAAPATVIVELDGGELQVEVGERLNVHLTGWARPVFAGRLSDEFVDELSELQ